MALSPSLSEGVQLTRTDLVAGRANTSLGELGTTGAAGVTEFVSADAGPAPLALTASTVKRYVVPVVRPLTVLLVGSGEPLTVTGADGVEPTYGVMRYELTGPPSDGAVQETLADVLPPTLAVAPVTCPGFGIAYMTSTQ